jgi:hypothetical protein
MIFIVVEAFSSSFLEIPATPTNSQLMKIIDELSHVYIQSTHVQTLEALKKIISPSKK